MRTTAAIDSIKIISKNLSEIFICAGTILNVEDAKKAVDAGAKIIISPSTNKEVISWCINNNIPIIPGCATPSEIEECMNYGLDLVKLFPAEVVGGVKMLNALRGPYSNIHFMPTGGINQTNVEDYLKLKNVVACGGSWMVSEKLIDEDNFEEIERLTHLASNIKRL